MLLKKYIWLSAATLLTACDLIDYHPYDGRLDSDTSREINPANIERIEKVCEGKDTIRFIFMGDTQRSYNETEDFVKYVNQLDSIDFIIHGGDYTEFGLKKEFEWNDDILSKLKVPYVGLIGNHDKREVLIPKDFTKYLVAITDHVVITDQPYVKSLGMRTSRLS